MRSIDRSTAVVALLFGVPPGLGVALGTLRVTGGADPLLAAGAGLLVMLGGVAAVLVLAGYGRPESPVHD